MSPLCAQKKETHRVPIRLSGEIQGLSPYGVRPNDSRQHHPFNASFTNGSVSASQKYDFGDFGEFNFAELPTDVLEIPDGEEKKLDQFALQNQLDRSQWTTIMIRNIPCRYTQEALLQEVTGTGFQANFLYLPPARRTRGNLGYAFVNFVTPSNAEAFLQCFAGHFFIRQPNSKKQAIVDYAKLQGYDANVKFYANTKVTKSHNRPWIAGSDIMHDRESVARTSPTHSLQSY